MGNYFSKLFKITPEQFHHRYWELGQSMSEIAEEFGSQGCKLKRHVIKAGIPIKTKQKAYDDRTAAGKGRKHFFNEGFFDEWSPAMAWMLGLVASDGNINQRLYRTVFASKDVELIAKFATQLDYHGPIETNNSGCPLIRVSSKRMAHRLFDLGITPAKTRTLRYPDIPDGFHSHFIRGFFDGDGTISVEENSNLPHLRLTITTVALNFARGLSSVLLYHGLDHAVYRIEPRGNRQPRYNIHAGAYKAVQLCQFIYGNSPRSICLERKRDIFENFMEEHGSIYTTGPITIRTNKKDSHVTPMPLH